MIGNEEVFPIGRVTRPHGTHGELEITFTDDAFERGDAAYLVFMLDGILVPFFMDEYRYKGQESVIVKFTDITSESKAKSYVGTQVFYPFKALDDEAEMTLSSYKALVGFRVVTAQGQTVGTIFAVDDSTANVLLYLHKHDDQSECVLPYHDDFLVAYDLKHRTLTLQLPEGLLHL